jgi:polyisoprenoid-binding protein YceI
LWEKVLGLFIVMNKSGTFFSNAWNWNSSWGFNVRTTGFISLLSILLLPLSALPEAVQYTADKWHTRIYFTVNHMGLSNFSGRFLEYDIEFMFDEKNLANSTVEVTVPVSSIDTFSPELNSKMGDEMFFDVSSHPEMRFISTNIEQVDASHALMTGDMTIKGTTLPVTFDVTFNKIVMHPRFSRNNAGFTATATIDSKAYDVNRLPDWMVANDVAIRIEMEAFEGDSVPYYSE